MTFVFVVVPLVLLFMSSLFSAHSYVKDEKIIGTSPVLYSGYIIRSSSTRPIFFIIPSTNIFLLLLLLLLFVIPAVVCEVVAMLSKEDVIADADDDDDGTSMTSSPIGVLRTRKLLCMLL